ncbi:glycosyltransferase [Cerasicoccus fimbriatus]|uniref:glycosyltransferase n=1 Tax=Cerasicoccus fimbriatus TaxID=3014554 RepID=UPI0022B52794|nr:glycosyltransferase [Cerasicoccus sp. TK19100]
MPLNYTVAICTYRRAEILKRVLDHWFDVYPKESVQFIIINNGMDEATRRLAEEHAFAHAIEHVFEDRAGVSHARNKAIECAKGDVLIYLDDDCLVDPSWLPSVRQHFESDTRKQIGMLGGAIKLQWDFEPPSWYHPQFISSFSGTDYPPGDYEVTSAEQWLGEGNSAYWKSHLVEVGRFSTDLGRVKDCLLSNEGNELRVRLETKGYQTWYSSTMSVSHIVFEERLRSPKWLLKRNFWGGVSHKIQEMRHNGVANCGKELRYLIKYALLRDVPHLCPGSSPSYEKLSRACQAYFRVGLLYAIVRYRHKF